MLTKLKAVNLLLASIKESPVNTLEGVLTEEAASAVNSLDEVTRLVQLDGWAFNTDRCAVLPKDDTGVVTLPTDVVRCDIYPDSYRLSRQYVVRGNRIYNRDSQTFVVDVDITAQRLVRQLPWDQLPEVARSYITYRARRVYQDEIVGSKDGERPITADEARALLQLKKEHGDQERWNMLASPGITEAAYR